MGDGITTLTEATLPTGTVTFLFTDIQGSTPMWDAHPSEMTTALGSEPWPEPLDLRVRMGVHTGEVQERDGDYFGPSVNRAARLMGAAHGGQVVASALTGELLDSSDGVELVDLGAVALKGVVDPVHVMGVSAAGLDWLDLPLISTQETAGNLPRLRTDSVADLADLQRRVSGLASARLVTLTGSGGVGKTRAALEVGWLVVDEFIDGVWMIELGPIADPDTVIAAVASTLAVQLQPEMTLVESIVDWCLGRRMLLILDNCEHVLDPISELAGAVISGCPTVTMIATSREPLGIAGEQVIRIPSLREDQGVELFCERATAADSTFSPSPGDLEAIKAICDRIDGIPLAIELAAARTRSLGPIGLLARLDDRFRLLRGAGRGGLERHQTLRAAVTWSYQLLSGDEQILFDRLTVFAGTFDLDAAERICAGDDIDAFDIFDLISALVDKSMVIAEHSDAGTRYRLLETLRQYGEERLDDRGETAQLRDHHLAHFRDLVERALDQWYSPQQPAADMTLHRECDNLRAAHNWAIVSKQLDSAESIVHGTATGAFNRLLLEHREWCSRSMTLGEEVGSTNVAIYSEAAFWAFLAADTPMAIDLARTGIERIPDDPRIGWCHSALCYALMAAGLTDEATDVIPDLVGLLSDSAGSDLTFMLRMALAEAEAAGLTTGDYIDEFVKFCREIGSPSAIARSLIILGNGQLSTEPPNIDRALASHREAIRQAEIGAPADLIWGHQGFANCQVFAQLPEARNAVRESLARSYDARLWLAVELTLDMCVKHLLETSPEAAATILGYLQTRPTPAFGILPKIRRESLAAVADMAEAAAWMAAGAAMNRHEVAKYALTQLEDD